MQHGRQFLFNLQDPEETVKMAAESAMRDAIGKRPICQDTGIVIAFVEVGMDVQWEADMSVDEMINEGVRRGYSNPDNVLRASVLDDPDGSRTNTKDNTPAVAQILMKSAPCLI